MLEKLQKTRGVAIPLGLPQTLDKACNRRKNGTYVRHNTYIKTVIKKIKRDNLRDFWIKSKALRNAIPMRFY